MPKSWQTYLRDTLRLTPDDVYKVSNHLNVGDFMELALLDLPALRYPPFVTRLPTEYRNENNIFDAIRKARHPYPPSLLTRLTRFSI